MKIYFVYYIGRDKEVVLPYDDERYKAKNLYAITSNKKLLKEFLSIRKKDVYKIKKEEALPSEYQDIANEFRECVIDRYTLMTRGSDGYEITNIDLALTQFEYTSCEDDNILDVYYLDINWWKNSLPVKCVANKKLKKALNTLQYEQAQKLSGITSDDADDYEGPNVELDQFHCFINMFGSMLSI